MSTANEVLNGLGEEIEVVEQSAATVQQYIELKDREVELPSSIDVYGSTLHRFQMVEEEMDLPMGSDTTTWVITGFDEEEKTITMKVPTDWESKTLTFEEFELDDNLTPLYYDHIDPRTGDVVSEPQWGY